MGAVLREVSAEDFPVDSAVGVGSAAIPAVEVVLAADFPAAAGVASAGVMAAAIEAAIEALGEEEADKVVVVVSLVA